MSKSNRNQSRPVGVDPYIRTLFGIAALVVIGALLTIIFAYLNGVIRFDDQATNIEEFTVISSIAYADEEGTMGSLSQLALAQIANGHYLEAELTIAEAMALNAPDEERNQGALFATAVLAHNRGEHEQAIELYEEVMDRLFEDWTRVYNSDEEPNWARAFGLHENYYDSAVALSFLYAERGEIDKQILMLDVAMVGMPTNADLFLWRGQAHLAQGDNAAAIEDFTEALRFIPDDEAALQGLEEAGGSE